MSTQAPSRASEQQTSPVVTVPPCTLAEALNLSRLGDAAKAFVAAVSERPDLPRRLARMGLAFKSKGQQMDARSLARAALRMAPDDFLVRTLTEWVNRHEAPLWHFPMLHDSARNEAYAKALKRFVQPGMTVFEIGTGSGLVAMLAAQAGASHVYTCERHPEVAATAREIIARNGFSDRVTVIHKDARQVRLGHELPARADLFVAELVEDGLLGDGVLQLTEHARHELLTPQAILLPSAISALGYLITGKGHEHNYKVDQVLGFDLTPFNRFTPLEMTGGPSGLEHEPLSTAVTLATFNLECDSPEEGSQRVTLTANRAGRVEAIMRWLRLDFGPDISFDNGPPKNSHWAPRLHILPQPRWMEPGDQIEIEVYHSWDQLFLLPAGDK